MKSVTPASPPNSTLKLRKILNSHKRGLSLTMGLNSPPLTLNTYSNAKMDMSTTSEVDVKAYREGDFYMQDYSTGISNHGLQSPPASSKFRNVTWHFISEEPKFESPNIRSP
jgi:hypothetical protein